MEHGSTGGSRMSRRGTARSQMDVRGFVALLAIRSITIPEFMTYAGHIVLLVQLVSLVFSPYMQYRHTVVREIAVAAAAFRVPFWDPTFVGTSNTVPMATYMIFYEVLAACLVVSYFAMALVAAKAIDIVTVVATTTALLTRAMGSWLAIPLMHAVLAPVFCKSSTGYLFHFKDEICWSPNHIGVVCTTAVIGLALIVVVFISGTMLNSVTPSTPRGAKPLAVAHAYCDMLLMGTIIVLVLLYHLLLAIEQETLFNALYALLLVINAMVTAIVHPFHESTWTSVRCSVCLLAAFVALVNIASAQAPWMVSRQLNAYVVFTLAPLVALLGVAMGRARRSSDLRFHEQWLFNHARVVTHFARFPFPPGSMEDDMSLLPPQFSSLESTLLQEGSGASRAFYDTLPYACEVLTPGLDRLFLPTDAEVACRFLADTSRITGKVPSRHQLAFAARIYTKSLVAFKRSPQVLYHFAGFLFHYASKLGLSLEVIEILSSKHAAFDMWTNYATYALSTEVKAIFGVRNVAHLASFDRAKRAHRELLLTMQHFWSKLLESRKDVTGLIRISNDLTAKRNAANELYRRALVDESVDRQTVNLYAMFLKDVMLDRSGADTYARLAEAMAEEKRSRLTQSPSAHLNDSGGGEHNNGKGGLMATTNLQQRQEAVKQRSEAVTSSSTFGASWSDAVRAMWATLVLFFLSSAAILAVDLQLLSELDKRVEGIRVSAWSRTQLFTSSMLVRRIANCEGDAATTTLSFVSSGNVTMPSCSASPAQMERVLRIASGQFASFTNAAVVRDSSILPDAAEQRENEAMFLAPLTTEEHVDIGRHPAHVLFGVSSALRRANVLFTDAVNALTLSRAASIATSIVEPLSALMFELDSRLTDAAEIQGERLLSSRLLYGGIVGIIAFVMALALCLNRESFVVNLVNGGHMKVVVMKLFNLIPSPTQAMLLEQSKLQLEAFEKLEAVEDDKNNHNGDRNSDALNDSGIADRRPSHVSGGGPGDDVARSASIGGSAGIDLRMGSSMHGGGGGGDDGISESVRRRSVALFGSGASRANNTAGGSSKPRGILKSTMRSTSSTMRSTAARRIEMKRVHWSAEAISASAEAKRKKLAEPTIVVRTEASIANAGQHNMQQAATSGGGDKGGGDGGGKGGGAAGKGPNRKQRGILPSRTVPAYRGGNRVVSRTAWQLGFASTLMILSFAAAGCCVAAWRHSVAMATHATDAVLIADWHLGASVAVETLVSRTHSYMAFPRERVYHDWVESAMSLQRHGLYRATPAGVLLPFAAGAINPLRQQALTSLLSLCRRTVSAAAAAAGVDVSTPVASGWGETQPPSTGNRTRMLLTLDNERPPELVRDTTTQMSSLLLEAAVEQRLRVQAGYVQYYAVAAAVLFVAATVAVLLASLHLSEFVAWLRPSPPTSSKPRVLRNLRLNLFRLFSVAILSVGFACSAALAGEATAQVVRVARYAERALRAGAAVQSVGRFVDRADGWLLEGTAAAGFAYFDEAEKCGLTFARIQDSLERFALLFDSGATDAATIRSEKAEIDLRLRHFTGVVTVASTLRAASVNLLYNPTMPFARQYDSDIVALAGSAATTLGIQADTMRPDLVATTIETDVTRPSAIQVAMAMYTRHGERGTSTLDNLLRATVEAAGVSRFSMVVDRDDAVRKALLMTSIVIGCLVGGLLGLALLVGPVRSGLISTSAGNAASSSSATASALAADQQKSLTLEVLFRVVQRRLTMTLCVLGLCGAAQVGLVAYHVALDVPTLSAVRDVVQRSSDVALSMDLLERLLSRTDSGRDALKLETTRTQLAFVRDRLAVTRQAVDTALGTRWRSVSTANERLRLWLTLLDDAVAAPVTLERMQQVAASGGGGNRTTVLAADAATVNRYATLVETARAQVLPLIDGLRGDVNVNVGQVIRGSLAADQGVTIGLAILTWLAVTLAAAVVTYPAIDRLAEEEGGARLLLNVIPENVVRATTKIHLYLQTGVTVDDRAEERLYNSLCPQVPLFKEQWQAGLAEADCFRLLDASEKCTVLITGKGIIEYVSEAQMKSLLGYLREELIGKNVKILMEEPLRSAHDRFLHAYTSGAPSRLIATKKGRDVIALTAAGGRQSIYLQLHEVTRHTGEHYFLGQMVPYNPYSVVSDR